MKSDGIIQLKAQSFSPTLATDDMDEPQYRDQHLRISWRTSLRCADWMELDAGWNERVYGLFLYKALEEMPDIMSRNITSARTRPALRGLDLTLGGNKVDYGLFLGGPV
jgi:hypothetical protein